MTTSTQESLWIGRIFDEAGLDHSRPVPMHSDNEAAFDIRMHCMREALDSAWILLQDVWQATRTCGISCPVYTERGTGAVIPACLNCEPCWMAGLLQASHPSESGSSRFIRREQRGR
jgi:hypothetical protein